MLLRLILDLEVDSPMMMMMWLFLLEWNNRFIIMGMGGTNNLTASIPPQIMCS